MRLECGLHRCLAHQVSLLGVASHSLMGNRTLVCWDQSQNPEIARGPPIPSPCAARCLPTARGPGASCSHLMTQPHGLRALPTSAPSLPVPAAPPLEAPCPWGFAQVAPGSGCAPWSCTCGLPVSMSPSFRCQLEGHFLREGAPDPCSGHAPAIAVTLTGSLFVVCFLWAPPGYCLSSQQNVPLESTNLNKEGASDSC